MKFRNVTLIVLGGAALLAQPERAGAQAPPPVQSLLPRKGEASRLEIPSSHIPPAGMCRIWIDNVPANQQPAPTDCASAVRNRPQNGRVIFADDYRGRRDDRKGARDGRDDKEDRRDSKDRRPKKPDPDDRD